MTVCLEHCPVVSEHMCQGWLEGYVLTGRHGLFASYEAFANLVASMVAQHVKWVHSAREVAWRRPVASLNYLLTSHAWRQDHNGFSHQDPGFIDHVLNKSPDVVRVYLPNLYEEYQERQQYEEYVRSHYKSSDDGYSYQKSYRQRMNNDFEFEDDRDLTDHEMNEKNEEDDPYTFRNNNRSSLNDQYELRNRRGHSQSSLDNEKVSNCF